MEISPSAIWLNTEKTIKDNSRKIVDQKATFEKRVRELENQLLKEKTERIEGAAHTEAEVIDLKAKIRQVASEHTVFEGRLTMTRQPNAVHVGESQMDVLYNVCLHVSMC